MDLIEAVIDHVIETHIRNIDARTVAAVKTVIVDTMGAAVAGSSAEKVPELTALVRGWGGKKEATLLVDGGRVPASDAALVNCCMARAWDIDEVHEGGGGHLSASVIPTAFILAQYSGKPISGKELIVSVAIATDLICRMRQALEVQHGWVAETFAPFGVVAVASRFLGFDRDRTLAAMGLAYAQCSSNTQGTVDGALSVRLQQGLAAKAGVLAAQFAEIGFAGPRNILEGTYGLYPLYARGAYNPEKITRELGERFEIASTSLKPYPSCKHTHIPIAAVARLVREHDIAPDNIARITVRTNRDAYHKCASDPAKRRPQSVVDLQFSIPLMVALAVKQGGVTLKDLKAATWQDESLLKIANKVETRIDPELDALPVLIAPNIIEMDMLDGTRHTGRVDFVKGSPQNPMTMAECSEKFMQCVSFSARPIAADNARQFMQAIADLENIDDIRPLAELLVGAAA